MDIVPVFCEIDDFCIAFEPELRRKLLADRGAQRRRATKTKLSEVMTIIIYFHRSGYRNFKTYYLEQVRKTMTGEFPDLVSYNRFVELMREAVVPLAVYLETRKAECSGISFVDSTRARRVS